MQSIYTPKYQITIWIGYSGNLFKNLKMEKINLFLMVSVACNKWLRMHYPHTINCEVTSHCVCPYVCANYYFTRYMVNIKSRLKPIDLLLLLLNFSIYIYFLVFHGASRERKTNTSVVIESIYLKWATKIGRLLFEN